MLDSPIIGESTRKNKKFENYLSIGEFSEISHASIKSLRYYEKIGAFEPAFIDPDTGYRYYSINQIYSLNLVRLCIEEGMDSKELKKYYSEGNVLDAGRFFQHCGDIAWKRWRSSYATMLRMEAYSKEYARQITADVLSQQTSVLQARTVLMTPLADNTSGLIYRDYVETLTRCIREAQNLDLITLAQQGVARLEDGHWYTYIELFREGSVNDDLPDHDDLFIRHMPSVKYQVRSLLGSDLERSFHDACNAEPNRDLVCVQEA